MVAPAFPLLLTNLLGLVYHFNISSPSFIIYAAFIQLFIQTFFDFFTISLSFAQGVYVSKAASSHTKMIPVKILIACIATQYTLWTYETHVGVLPKIY